MKAMNDYKAPAVEMIPVGTEAGFALSGSLDGKTESYDVLTPVDWE